MYTNKISLYFLIKSDVYSPDQITALLGINFHESQIKGVEVVSPNGIHTGHFHKTNSWILNNNDKNFDEAENYIENMLLFLDEHILKIKNLRDVEVIFSLGIQFEENIPGFHFDPEILQKISDIGASLDISLYDMKN